MKNNCLNKSIFSDLAQLVPISIANGFLVGSILIMLVMMLSVPAEAIAAAFPII